MRCYKSIPLFVSLCAALSLTGCALIPKNVEFFQHKVKPVPGPAPQQVETQKQAAAFVAGKTAEAKDEIFRESLTNWGLILPVEDAAAAAEALHVSLGPPASPWGGTSANLAVKLDKQANALDKAIDKARDKEAPDAGKKIEGTGWIQMSYFTYVGCLLGLGALVYGAFKIYGSINPVVGLGGNIAGRIGSGLLQRGFTEVLEGGEKFKDMIANSKLAEDVKNDVTGMFTTAHQTMQSRDTQTIVATLTK